jgi:DNA-binding transcriptional ArsR family regulator
MTSSASTPTTDTLSPVFSALADPTRRAILMRLMQSDATVAELGAPFTMSQPAVSKHLRVLEGAGLISRSRVATARYSHLEAGPMQQANEWMQQYKRFWNASFDRLDAALAEFLAETGTPAPDTKERPS